MPKGVVWRHEDVFFALGGGIDILTNSRVEKPQSLVETALAAPGPSTMMPIAPLMHGATQWAVMGQSFLGNKVVLMGKFDARGVWGLVQEEKVNSIMITGDAMARPLIEALGADDAAWDVSSLYLLTSSAATFSPSVKDQFFARFPSLMMIDAVGSSEGGNNGMVMVQAGQTEMKGGPTVSKIGHTVVLDEQGKPLEPGCGVIGKIARAGDIPLEYYKDPKKTAETFVTYDGVRYAIPGDFAMIEADGRITLLGRGSVSINTGGEKVYAEEVEQVLRRHPADIDAVVVGTPDERFGEQVTAVVQPRAGVTLDTAALSTFAAQHLARYKLPRVIVFVDEMVRSPSGKPDYRWGKSVATRELGVPP